MDDAVGDSRRGLDDKLAAVGGYHAAIAHLAAGFGVEAGLIQNQADFDVARYLSVLLEALRIDPAEQRAVATVDLVFVYVLGGRQFVIGEVGQQGIALLGGPSPLPLLVHQLGETIRVDGQPSLLSHQLRQVQREAIRVIELERVVAADDLVAR